MKKNSLIIFLISLFLIFAFIFIKTQVENTFIAGYQPNNYEYKDFEKFYNEAKTFDKEDYNNLVKDLDKNSKYTVDKILNDIIFILNNNGENKFNKIITIKEYFEILKYNKFYSKRKILKENDKILYRYDNYTFLNEPEPQIFFNKYGITKYLSYKSRIKIKNKDIIDAGAYIGDSSLVLSEFTNKKVYAFEPVPDIYNKLEETIKLNKNDKVVPVMLGLGDKNEVNLINYQLNFDSTSSLKYNFNDSKNVKKEKIELTTIDNFVKTNNLQVGLIKSDVEGYEQELLRGSENTIKTQKPVLLISIYHSADDFFHIKTQIEKWNLGYKFKIVKLNPNKRLYETILIAEIR